MIFEYRGYTGFVDIENGSYTGRIILPKTNPDILLFMGDCQLSLEEGFKDAVDIYIQLLDSILKDILDKKD